MQSISRNDHCVDRAILALLSRISGDIEIDDFTCGTKSKTTQDVLDTSYAVKGLKNNVKISHIFDRTLALSYLLRSFV